MHFKKLSKLQLSYWSWLGLSAVQTAGLIWFTAQADLRITNQDHTLQRHEVVIGSIQKIEGKLDAFNSHSEKLERLIIQLFQKKA